MEEHPQARFIVETLTQAGFIAYYAGGWVRDFLMNHPSDDIDIATNAPPEVIQKLFPRTVPIGIAFGIILVLIDHHQYEVATFRQDLDYQDGRRPSRIAFTTAEEDAKRRDFTINGMFYDPLKELIFDYVGGKEDIEKKLIRAIGDPHERIREDRLRMMRAIRLACRFDFAIDPKTDAAIRAHSKELFPAVAIERIVQELEKGKSFGKLRPMLLILHDYGLLETIFPTLQGISHAEIENRLLPLKNYPQKAPLIGQLLPLFSYHSLEFQLELCKTLKLSNLDQQFVTFLFNSHAFLQAAANSLSSWAYFYANAFAPLCLQIHSAHLENSQQFLQEHEKRMNQLSRFIQRIQNHDPVVRSQDLLKEGIVPGKTMGILLEEADTLSINEQTEDVDLIIRKLKKLPSWKIDK